MHFSISILCLLFIQGNNVQEAYLLLAPASHLSFLVSCYLISRAAAENLALAEPIHREFNYSWGPRLL